MTLELERRLAARTCARAFTNLFDGVPESARQVLGLSHRPLAGGTLLAAASLEHLMLNRVMGAAPSAIEQAVAVYDSLGVTNYLLSFEAEVIDEAVRVGTAHGLARFHRPWASLIRRQRDPRPLPNCELPDGIEVRLAAPGDADVLGTLMAKAFDVPAAGAPIFAAAIERPRWLALIAEHVGEIVGAGIAFLNEGCAYLAGGATAPAYRRRGIQRALVATRVRWAVEQGAHIICSETGVAVPNEPNSSWNNLVWAGLEPVGLVEHLCRTGARWK